MSVTPHRSFFKKSKLEIITIKADPKIFELYTSGESRRVTPYYVHLIVIGIFFTILIVILFSQVFSFEDSSPPSAPALTSESSEQRPSLSTRSPKSQESNELVCFICSLRSCSLRTKTVPIELVTKFVQDKILEPIASYKLSSYSRFCFLAPLGFFKNAPPISDDDN